MRYPTFKILGTLFSLSVLFGSPAYPAPYPDSLAITGITFDAATYRSGAPGTDNWPITWADDDNQYTSGGDGNGFAGIQRSSLLVSRVAGAADSYNGVDVWASAASRNGPADGKSYGIIAIDGELYMWVSPGSNIEGYRYAEVWKSSDRGQSWTSSGWRFDGVDAFGAGQHSFINPTFLQFGRDYQGARDNFVYMYANELEDTASLSVQTPGNVSLLRVPKAQIMSRDDYEFFAGTDANNNPTWSSDIQQRRPVFQDENGVGWNLSVSFNAGLDRYLLITEHTQTFESNIGIFDSATPWGPWTTVLYERWSVPGSGPQSHFFWNFSNKWLSEDGKRFVMISSGVGDQDRWNTVEGNFVTDDIAVVLIPKSPSNLTAQ